jgi:hypothetical protein
LHDAGLSSTVIHDCTIALDELTAKDDENDNSGFEDAKETKVKLSGKNTTILESLLNVTDLLISPTWTDSFK